MKAPLITISIVSHEQAELASLLLRDIARLGRDDLQILYTMNVPEPLPAEAADSPITVVRNASPHGFARNHNAAFRAAQASYFCVLNPDLRIHADPFPALLPLFDEPRVGAASPSIVDASGRAEDHARRFPTFRSLAAKLVRADLDLDYEESGQPFSPDWIAGMFMLFRRSAFQEVGGFDERYFLYYEDIDICRRLRRSGYDIRVTPSARTTHNARRASRHNVKYMLSHARSMLRYFTTRYS
jgi:GT2 family glycosyltransferase